MPVGMLCTVLFFFTCLIESEVLGLLVRMELSSTNKSIENGREKTGLDVFEWLKIIIEKGAGEIIITSIDKEGTMRGCDVELIKKTSEISTIPVIASGGVGKIDHIIELLKNTEIEGLAIASSIHYKKINLDETKNAIKNLRKVRFDY